jgi:hypothetical protein
MLSLGTFPDVSLKLARERRDQARRDLANGIDPSAKRRTEKMASGNTFEAVAREWFEKFSPNWASGYSSKVIRRLEIPLAKLSLRKRRTRDRALASHEGFGSR